MGSAGMLAYFQQADTNSDGVLSSKEFGLFVGDAFLMPPSKRFVMFALLDNNVNGLLAYSEFVNGFSIPHGQSNLQLEWTGEGASWGPNYDMKAAGYGYMHR